MRRLPLPLGQLPMRLLPLLLLAAHPGCTDTPRHKAKARASRPPGARGERTAPPQPGPALRQAPPYDPATDPDNRAPGGFDLAASRSPVDPAARKRKPLTIEALYRAVRVSDPRWSPDGKRLLFTVTRDDLRHGKSNSEIYLINADGSGLRQMTRHDGADSAPRWAPDGRSLFFRSSRSGKPQIYRMPVDGGEPEQLTHLSTGVDEHLVAPDGVALALVSSVFPEHGANDDANAAQLKRAKDNPLQAYLADELLYRHWTSFSAGRRTHVLWFPLGHGDPRDLTPGDTDSPAFSLGGGGLDLSPDGAELCVSSNRQAPTARATGTNKDLWVHTTGPRGGNGTNLTADNRGFDGEPRYSPDGKWIAFVRQQQPGYESAQRVLALYERKTGKVRLLTHQLDTWVLAMRWSRDSRSLVLRTAFKGRFPLFRVSVPDGRLQRLAIPSVREFDVAPDGRLAFTASRIDRPLELFVADADGRKVKRVTHFNRELVQAYDLRPAEELWLPGAGGRKVHTFVVKPHNFRPGKRYPLILNVHGGPQYQWADSFRGDWQVYPAAGYVVAFPNPHGSIGYGQAYTAAISKDWGGKVYDDVMRVTDALAALPYVDGERMGAMGWSYGGYMMNWLLGHTTRFRALASMMGLYDLPSFYGATEELWFPEWDVGGTPWEATEAYRRWSPSSYAGRFKTPTLVLSGMRDFRVPYTQSLQLFTALRRQDVPARLVLFKNDGHWPSYVKSMPLYYAAHLDWFHRYLGGAPSPYDIRKLVQGQVFQQEAPSGRDH